MGDPESFHSFINKHPQDPELCYELGKFLYQHFYIYFRHSYIYEAINKLNISINLSSKKRNKICKTLSKNFKNLIINQFLSKWHINMLNDLVRNNFYFSSIKSNLKNTDAVLDIGSGCGILSCMSNKFTSNIYAFEHNPLLYKICSDIIKNFSNIICFEKSSFDCSKKDIPSINILVLELFDSGFFGEGINDVLLHFWTNFAGKHAKIIPHSSIINFALIESQHIRFKTRCKYNSSDLSFDGMSAHTKCFEEMSPDGETLSDPYLSEKLTHNEYVSNYSPNMDKNIKYIIPFTELFTYQLGNVEYLNEFEKYVNSSKPYLTLQTKCQSAGWLDAICVSFILQSPNDINGQTFTLDSLQRDLCWEQAIYPMAQPIYLEVNEIIVMEVYLKENYLSFVVNKTNTNFMMHGIPTSYLSPNTELDLAINGFLEHAPIELNNLKTLKEIALINDDFYWSLYLNAFTNVIRSKDSVKQYVLHDISGLNGKAGKPLSITPHIFDFVLKTHNTAIGYYSNFSSLKDYLSRYSTRPLNTPRNLSDLSHKIWVWHHDDKTNSCCHILCISIEALLDPRGLLQEEFHTLLALLNDYYSTLSRNVNGEENTDIIIIPNSMTMNATPIQSAYLRQKTCLLDQGFVKEYGIAKVMKPFQSSIFMDFDIQSAQDRSNYNDDPYQDNFIPLCNAISSSTSKLCDPQTSSHILTWQLKDLLTQQPLILHHKMKSVTKEYKIQVCNSHEHFMDGLLFWFEINLLDPLLYSLDSNSKKPTTFNTLAADNTYWKCAAYVPLAENINGAVNDERIKITPDTSLISFDITVYNDIIDFEYISTQPNKNVETK